RQHLLLSELQRLLLVAGGELLVALDGREHVVGHLLHQLVGLEVLRLRRHARRGRVRSGRGLRERIASQSCGEKKDEKTRHAASLAFSFSFCEPLNIPGSSEWRSSRR